MSKNPFPWPGLSKDVLTNYVDQRAERIAINLVTGRIYIKLSRVTAMAEIPLTWVKTTSTTLMPITSPIGSRAQALKLVAPHQKTAGTRYNAIALYRGAQGVYWPTEINPLTAPRIMDVYGAALAQARADAKAAQKGFTDLLLWYVGARLGAGAAGKKPSVGTSAREAAKKGAKSEATKKAAGAATAAQSFSLASTKVWHFAGRDIVVVRTSRGVQAFYRRTGLGSLGSGGAKQAGAKAGDWAPFDGFIAGHFLKARYTSLPKSHSLFRYGMQELKSASEWLARQGITKGDDVGDAWGKIQAWLKTMGALKI